MANAKNYVARWGFVLGHPVNLTLHVGDELVVNGGSIVQGMQEIPMPSIRGAISQGWLVLADSPEGKKAIAEGERKKDPKDPGFAHLTVHSGKDPKNRAEADGIDVGAKRRRDVETDADRVIGELKTPVQMPEFIVKG